MKEVTQALKESDNPLFKYWHYLKEGERNCVYLYFMCEWSQKEIGKHYGYTCQEYGCPNVSRCIGKGLKRLKELMNKYELEKDLNYRLKPVRIEDERFINSN